MAQQRTRQAPQSKQPTSRRGARRRRNQRRQSLLRWGLLATLAAALAFAGMLLVTSREGARQSQGQQTGRPAPSFTLSDTDGKQVLLAGYRGRNVLLYLSEGVGCDGCWYQMAGLEKHGADLDKLGVTVLPIVVNDLAATRAEMRRFNLRTPFLTDPDGAVARAYDAVGSSSAMHADLPGHTFILVERTGRITWRGEYPSMFVPTTNLLAKLRTSLAG